MFDESRKVGGLSFDPNRDLAEQVSAIVDVLCKKLEEERQIESRIAKETGLLDF